MLHNHNHPVILQPGALDKVEHYASSLSEYSQFVVISHPSLLHLYGNALLSSLKSFQRPILELLIPEGERSKSLQQANRCWKKMAEHHIDRKAAIIALGGGVICDLAGFIASCYMRGLDAIYLPTTLMAMVDASIGGKTGINLPLSKNAIGTFSPPKLVIIDPSCLKTLAPREFNSGLAEVIKYGILDDSPLFDLLEKQIEKIKNRDPAQLNTVIAHCLNLKQKIVSQDPKDQNGQRASLNYGHTFGHAIEAATAYRLYLHGEAISIGMSCEAQLSVQLNLCSASVAERQDLLSCKADLPIDLPKMPVKKLLSAMLRDKKCAQGKIILILPEKIGKVLTIPDVDPCLIKQILLAKMK